MQWRYVGSDNIWYNRVMNKILIVIPAYNEGESIKKVILDIRKNTDFDILVINDASKDNTEEVLRECKANYISNLFNMGYALSLQTGIKYAERNGYTHVIQMDADGQHLASEANKIYQYAKEHEKVDIVIGSRFLKNTQYEGSRLRRMGTKIFELMIRMFCHKKITDPMSGFQCLNRRVIHEYANADYYPEYPDANLLIEMLCKGYKIAEVPVKMAKREHGESMHGGIVKPIKYMVKMFYAVVVVFVQNFWRKKTNE